MATAKKTEKIVKTVEVELVLTEEEAQLLANVYGWAVAGEGAHIRLFGNIYDALAKAGIKYSYDRPPGFPLRF